jgi:diguanylate cyclase (GGDEF)-like protein
LNGRPFADREIVDGTWMTINGDRDFLRRRAVGGGGWSLVMLMVPRGIFASRVLGIIITLMMATVTLVYLVGRERWVHDGVQLARRRELEELARTLDQQATTDPLTGLFNRSKFDHEFARELARAQRHGSALSLIIYDVDRFKNVNDTYGHQAGDKVLIELSRLVAGNIRKSDILARWGGEEFMILVPEATGAMAVRLAENLRDAIREFAFATGAAVTCSFGIAQFQSGDGPATLVSRADVALYRAKINGRDRVELAPHFDTGRAGHDLAKPDLISAA